MKKIDIRVGVSLKYKNEEVIIIRIIDLQRVCVEEPETNIIHTVNISELSPIENSKEEKKTEREIFLLTDKQWEKAQKRFRIIEPILETPGDLELIKELATENNIHFTTIYRWLNLFEETGCVSSLVGHKRTGGRGKSRLKNEVENVIQDAIETVYLNSNRKSINRTIREIEKQCSNKNIKNPHSNTIRNRIKNISEKEKIKTRYGAKKSKYQFDPIISKFPGADYPLAVVQIDHTRLDIILVDEYFRKPVERPWLTLAIDVYSRIVTGFYLSFDPPGALGTGLCIANSILPKDNWLEKLGIQAEWPCWGIMKKIHVDNGKEFRGNMIKRACKNYGIELEWRPVATPHYGGHVERLLGTFAKEIHDLPGTTFSNTFEKDNYDSVGKASLTLEEMEKWLTLYISNVYHIKTHSSIGESPISKFKKGVFGSSSEIGIGLPSRIFNEKRVRLDFMPFVERSIQEYGIVIDHIHYYDEVLRRYIHSKDSDKKPSKFLFRRDPRDISVIYFYDPELNDYYEIPYRDTSQPPMSIWEHREILRKLKKDSISEINETMIFEAYRNLEEIELNAIQNTKKIKRISRIVHNRARNEILADNNKKITKPELVINKNIKPFEELEDEAFTPKDL